MKNEIKKLVLITLTMTGLLSQIGCDSGLKKDIGLNSSVEQKEAYSNDEWYDNFDYDSENYVRQKMDPSILSTIKRDEVATQGLCQENRTGYLKMSDVEIFQFAINRKIGNCLLYDSFYEPTYCSGYVKVTTSTWPQQGWALNPESLDSTGCVSQDQYPGYTLAMVGENLALNAVEQIRDALRHPQDVCGLCNSTRVITTQMVLVQP